MKTTHFLKFKNILSIFIAVLLFSPFLFNLATARISYAENKLSIDSSKFIYNPTYSTFYNGNIFFIDNYNNEFYFKVFNSSSDTSSYANSSQKLDFGVIDAFSTNNFFFILSDTTIKFADLSNENIAFSTLPSVSLESSFYKSIFVYNYNSEYVITLSPADNSKTSPIVLVYSSETNSIIKTATINDSYLNANITFLATLKISESSYCYIRFGESTLKYNKITNLQNGSLTLGNTSEITSEILDSNPQTTILGVNMISLSDEDPKKEYFFITYQHLLNQ